MQNEKKITVQMTLDLDEIDSVILDSLSRFPTKRWKVSQLKIILEYKGFSVSSAQIRDRLRLLRAFSVISSEKGRRVHSYLIKMTCTMSPAPVNLLYSSRDIVKAETGPDEVIPSGEKRSSSVFWK